GLLQVRFRDRLRGPPRGRPLLPQARHHPCGEATRLGSFRPFGGRAAAHPRPLHGRAHTLGEEPAGRPRVRGGGRRPCRTRHGPQSPSWWPPVTGWANSDEPRTAWDRWSPVRPWWWWTRPPRPKPTTPCVPSFPVSLWCVWDETSAARPVTPVWRTRTRPMWRSATTTPGGHRAPWNGPPMPLTPILVLGWWPRRSWSATRNVPTRSTENSWRAHWGGPTTFRDPG